MSEKAEHLYCSRFPRRSPQENKAALNGRISAYYLGSTSETHLPSLRTAAEPNVYQRLHGGSAILDGYPLIRMGVNV